MQSNKGHCKQARNLSTRAYAFANKKAEETGWFEKSFPEEDLPILEFVYRRTQELYERFGRGWHPGFSETEVAEKIGLKRNRARRPLNRLIGLLGLFRDPYRGFDVEPGDYGKAIPTPFWFVPQYREALIKELLFGPENTEHPNQMWLFPEAQVRRRRDYQIGMSTQKAHPQQLFI